MKQEDIIGVNCVDDVGLTIVDSRFAGFVFESLLHMARYPE